MTKQNIDELEIYYKSIELADKIWHLVIEWTKFGRETLGYQIIRASDSIASNISAGHGRFFFKENRVFCYVARGSLYETKTFLIKARNRKLLTLQDYTLIHGDIEMLIHKLNAYIKYIEVQINNLQV
jgi:four helix bundle protein